MPAERGDSPAAAAAVVEQPGGELAAVELHHLATAIGPSESVVVAAVAVSGRLAMAVAELRADVGRRPAAVLAAASVVEEPSAGR